jgi:hypothetical protein
MSSSAKASGQPRRALWRAAVDTIRSISTGAACRRTATIWPSRVSRTDTRAALAAGRRWRSGRPSARGRTRRSRGARSGTRRQECLDSPEIRDYRALSTWNLVAMHDREAPGNREFSAHSCAVELVDRTQEVGGSSPPSSTWSKPLHVRGFRRLGFSALRGQAAPQTRFQMSAPADDIARPAGAD